MKHRWLWLALVGIFLLPTFANGAMSRPAAPTLNSVKYLGSVELFWTYTFISGGTPDTFIIEENIPPATTWFEAGRASYAARSWTISGMTFDAQYCFRLVAVSGSARGTPSGTLCATIHPDLSLTCVPAGCSQ